MYAQATPDVVCSPCAEEAAQGVAEMCELNAVAETIAPNLLAAPLTLVLCVVAAEGLLDMSYRVAYCVRADTVETAWSQGPSPVWESSAAHKYDAHASVDGALPAAAGADGLVFSVWETASLTDPTASAVRAARLVGRAVLPTCELEQLFTASQWTGTSVAQSFVLWVHHAAQTDDGIGARALSLQDCKLQIHLQLSAAAVGPAAYPPIALPRVSSAPSEPTHEATHGAEPRAAAQIAAPAEGCVELDKPTDQVTTARTCVLLSVVRASRLQAATSEAARVHGQMHLACIDGPNTSVSVHWISRRRDERAAVGTTATIVQSFAPEFQYCIELDLDFAADDGYFLFEVRLI